MPMNDRLYRSRSDRMIAGVAGGLAERFDIDPSFVRVAWVLLTILTGGIFFVAYIVMAIVVPEDPIDEPYWNGATWQAGAAQGGSAGGFAGGSAASTSAFTSMGGDVTPPGPAAGGASDPATDGQSPGAAPGPTPPGPGAAGFAAPAGPGQAGPGPAPGSPDWSARSARAQRRADRDAQRAARRSNGGYTGAVIGGLILVVIGTYFLVRTAVPDLHLEWFWPAALVLLGLVLIVGSVRRAP
jgi:phage shock protein PspC (stress-responsive transcriptional regulator)